MSKYRVFLKELSEHQVFLHEDEIHHLVRVRRCREGTLFEGIDPASGRAYLCRLQKGEKGWSGEVVRRMDEATESFLEVGLAQALIKRDQFEWVLQKSVELGVVSITPLITERTEIRFDDRREEKKMTRWNRIIAEAVKQSRRTKLPVLHEPLKLENYIKKSSDELLLVLDEAGKVPFKEFLRSQRKISRCSLMVGPEGGWSERDRSAFVGAGLPQLRLGRRILRAETAPLVGLSILQYEYGDLDAHD